MFWIKLNKKNNKPHEVYMIQVRKEMYVSFHVQNTWRPKLYNDLLVFK